LSARVSIQKSQLLIIFFGQKDNILILVYLNFTDKRFNWDQEKNEPGDCQLEVCSIRSQDGGKTWIDNQRLLSGYNP